MKSKMRKEENEEDAGEEKEEKRRIEMMENARRKGRRWAVRGKSSRRIRER